MFGLVSEGLATRWRRKLCPVQGFCSSPVWVFVLDLLRPRFRVDCRADHQLEYRRVLVGCMADGYFHAGHCEDAVTDVVRRLLKDSALVHCTEARKDFRSHVDRASNWVPVQADAAVSDINLVQVLVLNTDPVLGKFLASDTVLVQVKLELHRGLGREEVVV